MLWFVIFLAVVLPVAWLGSEFSGQRWLRIVMGTLAISVSFTIAYSVGRLDRLNSNAWFGAATSDLIDATLAQLKQGNSEAVVRELSALQERYHPSYENRGRYDVHVREYMTALESNAQQ